MNDAVLTCQNEQRRAAVRASDCLNGLDYLEVEIIEEGGRQQIFLCVHFLGPVPSPGQIRLDNIRIEGGQRIRDIRAIGLSIHVPEDRTVDGCLRIAVNKLGDFSPYTLRIVNLDPQEPLRLDARYSHLQFFFRAGCPSDLDCKMQPTCPPEPLEEPEIDYLAKDYASFRRLILDRLALIMPDWNERHVPDLGVTLVEILAYVGDYLSYYQDAVATEAYLDTARQRISVRRHVRLVDYPMHEGCNARTWVWLETSMDRVLPSDIFFITSFPNSPQKGTILRADDLFSQIPPNQYEVFKPVVESAPSEISIYAAHNKICFYTWGNRQCCLPKGATAATLRDDWDLPPAPQVQYQSTKEDKGDDCKDPEPPKTLPNRKLKLNPGDILIFEEVKGAVTGDAADADLTHRHVVRLTKVEHREDSLYPYRPGQCDGEVGDAIANLPTPIVEIEWAKADALPFPLCISAIGAAPECQLIENISVARGNVVLADHGRTVQEDLGEVEEKALMLQCEGEGQLAEAIAEPAPFRPHLQYSSLTFRQPISDQDLQTVPASRLLLQIPRQALPQVTIAETVNGGGGDWVAQPDLFSSHGQDRHFVVEMDDEGIAHLRFGDSELGRQPAAGAQFHATYRVGNGTAGNIGADTLAYLVLPEILSGIEITPHNPFAAQGGTPPESISDIKLFAPHDFRKELQRAVTAQDYAAIVMRDFSTQVQRAASVLRWTGSWYEVLVVVDPLGTEVADPALLESIANHLERFRRIGQDVAVRAAQYVFLNIEMTVCVKSDYLKGHVKAALLEVFSDRRLPDGRLGFFHPDNLTFGSEIAVSRLVAAAQAIPGVQNAVVTKLQRFAKPFDKSAKPSRKEIEQGVLLLNPLEVARLDNDPNFPENGQFVLDMRGGR